MRQKISILIVCLMMAVSGIVIMPLRSENGRAETWTQTITSEFEAGETAFVDIQDDTLQLASGLNRLWYGLGEAASDNFGWSVSDAGDVNGDGYDDIIVGAYYNAGAGEAYVYYGSASGPSATPDWSDQGEAADDYFGCSVSGAGDVNCDGYDDIMVGAYGNDGAGSSAGEAYVYYGSASGPSATPDWSDQGEAADDCFGYSVSDAGDVNGDGYDDIIVGAYGNDGAGSDAGEAYVYYGSASGPSATPDWSDLGEAASNWFGISVSGAGDVNCDGYDDIIVGAPCNDGAGSDAGEAYVYYGSASGPSATPDWSDQGEAADDWFGRPVSGVSDVNGDGYDDIIVGAPYNDDGGSWAGEAYVYYGSASGPSVTPDWSDQGEAADDRFGYSVSGAGDVNGDGYDDIIAGAYGNDGAGSDAGEAYVYYGSASGPSATPDWSDQGEAADDYFGYSVSGAGDVNGDGYDDIIVGAYGDDDIASSAGKAYLFGVSLYNIFQSWNDQGEAADDCFGYSVSGAGDVNGDGYDDIILGARYNDGGGSDAGEAYVYYGSAIGPSATPDWSDQGEAAGDYFGDSVSGAGDVNGDGYDDIIVGATGNDGAGSSAGEAYVYYGSASGPSATPDWSDQGEAADDCFGYSVSGAGDVNGDGYDDIIVGAYGNDGAGSDAGEAYVYYGSASGPSATPDWSDQGEAASNWFGISVSGARDVNCDGYDDIIVGAPCNDGAGSDAGEAYVYYGSASGPSATPDWSDQGEAAEDWFGRPVSGVGDVNRDGYDDIIVGAPYNGDGGSDAGEAYVYYGSASGPSATPDWSDQGEAAVDYFGYSVSGTGDVNGDGYDDFIVGAYNNDGAGSNAGEAYVYCMAQYAERGRFISDTFSVEGVRNVKWMSIDWRPFTQRDETSVKFQIATNDDGSTWEFKGPDGTEDTFYTNPHDQVIFSGQEGRFLKVRIYLTTTIGSRTPVIEEFSINYVQYDPPFVVITSPNGGEDWMEGAYYPITWSAEGDFNATPVCLYYSTNNGDSWTVIANWTANTGHYNWTVPAINTANAMIRVDLTDVYGSTVSDTSDASFAIDPPPQARGSITAPAANEIWGEGTHAILWSLDGNMNFVALEYTLDGEEWTEIGSGLPDTNAYTWDVPTGINSRNARIRLRAQDELHNLHTFKSGIFTIDTEIPVIVHEPVTEGGVGSIITFEASASDNFELSSVTILYNDGSGFVPFQMTEEGGLFRATTVPDTEGSLEYYITASDGVNSASTDVHTVDIHSPEKPEPVEESDFSWFTGAVVGGGIFAGIVIGLVLSRYVPKKEK